MDLKQFLRKSTKRERAEVAIVCHDSVSYFYQIAGKHRCASPLMATQIEKMTRKVAAQTKGRLEVVPRETLVKHPEIFLELDSED